MNRNELFYDPDVDLALDVDGDGAASTAPPPPPAAWGAAGQWLFLLALAAGMAYNFKDHGNVCPEVPP